MSLFGRTEMEYLCFWVTYDGVKPMHKKIKAIKIRSHQLDKNKYDSI